MVGEVDALALGALKPDLAIAGPVEALAVPGAVVAALRVAHIRRRRHHEPEELPTPGERRYSVEKWLHRVAARQRRDVFIYRTLVSGRVTQAASPAVLSGEQQLRKE